MLDAPSVSTADAERKAAASRGSTPRTLLPHGVLGCNTALIAATWCVRMLQTGLVSLPDEILQRFSLTVLWLDHNKLSRLPPEFALLTLLEARHPAPVANQSAHRLQISATVANQRNSCKSAHRMQIRATVANSCNDCKSAQRLEFSATVANQSAHRLQISAMVATPRNGCKSAHRFPLSDTLQCDTVQHVATQ